MELWTQLFDMMNFKRFNNQLPLTSWILSNPSHDFTKMIIYIYSMETFVYSDINSATRNKDFSKIDIFGPFASVLGFIIQVASQQDYRSLPYKFKTYRGMLRLESELDEF